MRVIKHNSVLFESDDTSSTDILTITKDGENIFVRSCVSYIGVVIWYYNTKSKRNYYLIYNSQACKYYLLCVDSSNANVSKYLCVYRFIIGNEQISGNTFYRDEVDKVVSNFNKGDVVLYCVPEMRYDERLDGCIEVIDMKSNGTFHGKKYNGLFRNLISPKLTFLLFDDGHVSLYNKDGKIICDNLSYTAFYTSNVVLRNADGEVNIGYNIEGDKPLMLCSSVWCDYIFHINSKFPDVNVNTMDNYSLSKINDAMQFLYCRAKFFNDDNNKEMITDILYSGGKVGFAIMKESKIRNVWYDEFVYFDKLCYDLSYSSPVIFVKKGEYCGIIGKDMEIKHKTKGYPFVFEANNKKYVGIKNTETQTISLLFNITINDVVSFRYIEDDIFMVKNKDNEYSLVSVGGDKPVWAKYIIDPYGEYPIYCINKDGKDKFAVAYRGEGYGFVSFPFKFRMLDKIIDVDANNKKVVGIINGKEVSFSLDI